MSKSKPSKAAKPKYREKAKYALGDWVEIRGKPSPGRITVRHKMGDGLWEFDVECLGGKTHTGVRAFEMRPWVRPEVGQAREGKRKNK